MTDSQLASRPLFRISFGTAIVLPFDSPDAMLAAVGGKGANLSHLTRAGFPVPPGFLITTAAYRAFVQTNDLQAQIARWQ